MGTTVETEARTVSDQPNTWRDGTAVPGSSGSKPTGWLPPAVRRLVPIVLAVLVLAAAVGVGLLGWQAMRAADAERAAAEALDAARTSTGQALSFDSKTIDADLARSRAVVSGAFAAQFEQRVNEVIMPAVRQQAVTTKAEVVRAALIGVRPGQVDALLFVDQTTTTSARPQPQRTPVQIRVTMTRTDDGRWLLSDLQPLG
jgi:Mce-associated membrane protein